MKTCDCPLRIKRYVSGASGMPSKRATYLCRARFGIFLKDWKCVGITHPKCPKTEASK